jgi:hypothetical protein
MSQRFSLTGLLEWLFSTPVSRAGLCPCPCHVGGIYSGVSCPLRCPALGRKFDGCHSCGCPGTACVLGECYTASRNIVITPKFGLNQSLRWKKNPAKFARICEIHFGLYTVELVTPVPHAGKAAGYRFHASFAETEDWFDARSLEH